MKFLSNFNLNEKFNSFKNATFFNHVVIDNFLIKEVVDSINKEVEQSTEEARPYFTYNVKKFGLNDPSKLGSKTNQIIDYFNSDEFLKILESITGIKELIADKSLEGGGLHFVGKDGYLRIHADFTSHIIHKNLKRRLNLLLYFNENWEDHNNGNIQFWNKDLSKKISYKPDFNRAVLFATDKYSYHGHPEKLNPPKNVNYRKSLALYYYTKEENAQKLEETNFKVLKNEKFTTKIIVKLDQLLLRIFSFLKRSGLISDNTVTKIIGFFVKKK